MIQRIILALAVSLAVSPGLLAQTQTPPKSSEQQNSPAKEERDDIVRITTNLVQIDAVVLKDGRPVKDLKADDFELFEDGRRQVITSFSYIPNVASTSTSPAKPTPEGLKTPPPVNPSTPHRTVALVVDDLGLSNESMNHVRRQIRKFIAEQLNPNDLVAIMRTGGTLGALQQFTNDRRISERAISQLRWNICSRVGVNYFSPAGSMAAPSSRFGACGGNGAVSETLRALRFVVEAMGELPGRKSLILFSDSIPREEQEDFFERDSDRDRGIRSIGPDLIDYNQPLYKLAEKAIRASVVIHAIDAAGLQYTGLTAADQISAGQIGMNEQINQIMTSRSRLILARREGAELIATQTGGRFVRNSNDFMLDQIVQEESGYYLLGYRPAEETFNKKFHRIKAKVKRSGMTVRTRHGFYGITEDEAARHARSAAQQSTIALMSPFGAQQIELDLTSFFANEKVKGSYVRSFIYLKTSDLTFEEDSEGWQNAKVQFRGIVFGDNGAKVNEVTLDRLLSFRGETFQRALRTGLAIQFDIPVKRPGAFQVRVSARDIRSGHIGSTGQFVQVPDLKKDQLALSGIVLDNPSSSSPDGNEEITIRPALRQFSRGQAAHFAFVIYNARFDAAGKPNVLFEARLFRDDKQVHDNQPMAVSLDNQPDFTRLIASGVVKLDPQLEPGNYYLQLIVSDKLRKLEPVTQWIDFEIVK